MTKLDVFNQTLDWLDGAKSRLSRQAFQWLRPLVDGINGISDVADEALAASCPTGSVMPFAGAAAPAGWVLCDGTSYARAGVYAALFAAISTTWGAADGSHFSVPDFRGRALIGAGTGSGLTARTLGAHNIGEETHQLTAAELAAHTHGVGTLTNANESAHTHGIGTYVAANESAHTHAAGSLAADSGGAHTHGLTNLKNDAGIKLTSGTPAVGDVTTDTGTAMTSTLTDSGGAHTHTVSGTSAAGAAHTHTLSGSSAAGSAHTHTISGSSASAGSDTAHNTMQPSAVVNWIIKT